MAQLGRYFEFPLPNTPPNEQKRQKQAMSLFQVDLLALDNALSHAFARRVSYVQLDLVTFSGQGFGSYTVGRTYVLCSPLYMRTIQIIIISVKHYRCSRQKHTWYACTQASYINVRTGNLFIFVHTLMINIIVIYIYIYL